MCNWCGRLNEAMKDLRENDYSGVAIHKENIEFYPWDKTEEDKVRIELWYTQEHGRDKREFIIELGMRDKNRGEDSGIRMVAPIKYCPNCGRKLLTK